MVKGEEVLRECRSLTNAQLIAELCSLAEAERVHVIKILTRLVEMGRRELAQETGYSSLFMFCVRKLRFSEATAFRRTKAAEACARFPRLLELIEAGDLHVAGVAAIADHLTEQNHEGLIRQAKGASRREVERLVAGLSPQIAKPAERTRIVAVAPKTADELNLEPAAPPTVELRTEHSFTFSDESEAKLQRARDLLRHKFPMGGVEEILDAALDALLKTLEDTDKPRPDSAPRPPEKQTRHIPEWVKRKVRARDGNCCAYVGPDGTRCGERGFLEFDHIVPWSQGGSSDDPDNIRQVCRSYNQWRAWKMTRDGRAATLGLELGP